MVRDSDGPLREAASLLAAAEALLDVEEDWEAALAQSSKALECFKDASDQQGVADALRLIVASLRAKAQANYDTPDKDPTQDFLEQAESRLQEGLASFREKDDQYGEACMLLSAAEMCLARRKASQEALQNATEQGTRAAAVFKDLKVERLRGQAHVAVSSLRLRAQAWRKSETAAREALGVFEALGDARARARALHALASALLEGAGSDAEALEEGLRHATTAVALLRDLGLKKAEASELYFLAGSYLALGRPREALPLAKQAMQLFEDLQYGKGWQAESRGLVVRIYQEQYSWREARRTAWDGVLRFREKGDKRCLVLTLDNLIHCHLEATSAQKGDLAEAKAAAEEAKTACRELGDKKWEANQEFNLAQISVREQNWEAAEMSVGQATKLDEEIGEDCERAVKLQLLVDIHLRTKEQYPKALKVAQDIRDIYRQKGLRQEEAGACLLVAQCLAASKELQQALATAAEAQAMYQEQADTKGEACAWDFLAQLRRMAGEGQKAEEAFQTGKDLQQRVGDKKAQAYSLQASAGLFAAQGRFDAALRAAFEALALARASGDAKAEVEMLMLVSQAHLGSIFARDEHGDAAALIREAEAKALRPAREAVVLARKHGDKYFLAGAIFATAQVHLFTGRADAGMTAAREAQELWTEVSNPGGAAHAMVLVAEGLFLKSNLRAAEDEAHAAARIFQDLGEKDGEEKALEAIARFREGPLRGGGKPVADLAAVAEAPDSAAVGETPVKALEMEEARRMALETAAQVIGNEDELDLDSPLMDLGLDSLSAIAFREQLAGTSGLNVPSSLVFDYPSLHAIASHLVEMSVEAH